MSENLAKPMESNEQLGSQFIVLKKVNTVLEKRVIELEKSQAKTELYSRRNNVETSGIPHEIFDNNLEDKVIDICSDADIKIGHMHFNDDCHLYAIYDIQNIYCKSRFLFYYFRVIFFLNVTFYNNFIT